MQTAPKPRDTVTQTAFHVAPHLIGTPLARPWRRGVAVVLDLFIAGLLIAAFKSPVILGAAGLSVFVYRLTGRIRTTSPISWRLAKALRLIGIVFIFGTSIAAFSSLATRVRQKTAGEEAKISGKGVKLDNAVVMAGVTVSDIIRLARAKDEDRAQAAAERIAARIVASDLSPEEVGELQNSIERGDIPLSPIARTALRASLRTALRTSQGAQEGDRAAAPSPDSLVLALADALRTGAPAAAEPLRRNLTTTLARDTLQALTRQNQKLSQRVDQLKTANDQLIAEQEAADHRFDPIRLIRVLLDDLGIGLGWTALYFTAFTAVGRGRTPGKRLLGIRVVQLDGKALGWWASFERFGGYAAGFVTGLFGFAQIYWDRNRQATHDKISETVVIRG